MNYSRHGTVAATIRLRLDEQRIIKETRATRIRDHYTEAKVKVIEDFEGLYEGKYQSEGFHVLARPLRSTIRFYSSKWTRKISKTALRLTSEDFESEMWEEAWLFLQSGRANPQFYLLEQLQLRFDSRALDVIRSAMRKKRAPDLTALPLPHLFEETYPDPVTSRLQDHIVASDTVSHMLADESLTDEEHLLLVFLYENPNATLQEIAELRGTPYRQTAKRAIGRLRTKLLPHYADCA
jgi:hypothetical protein